MNNFFESLPCSLKEEIIEELVKTDSIRIERIISNGQHSPETGWYDQDENEWVMVLEGTSILTFEDGREVTLREGDFINIPKHEKHRVTWTDPNEITLWLAIFYS